MPSVIYKVEHGVIMNIYLALGNRHTDLSI